jgi:hypothetical protein
MYEYENLAVTLSEKHRMRVPESWVPTKYGHKEDDITGSWRKYVLFTKHTCNWIDPVAKGRTCSMDIL